MFKFYLKEVFSKKARTFLIALSVAVGVASVLLIDAISSSGTRLINDELDSLGIRGFSVTKSASTVNQKLNNGDLKAIKDIECVNSATPIITTTGFFREGTLPSAVFCGVDETAGKIIALQKIRGDALKGKHIKEKSKICLIDMATKDALFGSKSKGIGENVNALICGKSVNLRVIGIVKSGSSILQSSIGEMLPTVIYLPYTALQDIIGNDSIDQIAVNTSADFADTSDLENAISLALKDSTKKNLIVNNLNKGREDLNSLLNIVTVILKLIGGISLLVSGLGITTVTLMSVGERKREIGIKKSIGAKRSSIAFEFLTESLLITLLGVILGLAFSNISTLVIVTLFNINFSISLELSLTVTLIALFCSMVFSTYPAYKAATLKPIDALKEES